MLEVENKLNEFMSVLPTVHCRFAAVSTPVANEPQNGQLVNLPKYSGVAAILIEVVRKC